MSTTIGVMYRALQHISDDADRQNWHDRAAHLQARRWRMIHDRKHANHQRRKELYEIS